MRAISLWQPYASAIPLGYKSIETRHWETKYRGPLLIHAAKKQSAELKAFIAEEQRQGRLEVDLPLGAIVAICRLTSCTPTEDINHDPEKHGLTRIERHYGNYQPGRYGWTLEDIRPVEPIYYRGGQSFFNVPDELLPSAILRTYA